MSRQLIYGRFFLVLKDNVWKHYPHRKENKADAHCAIYVILIIKYWHRIIDLNHLRKHVHLLLVRGQSLRRQSVNIVHSIAAQCDKCTEFFTTFL